MLGGGAPSLRRMQIPQPSKSTSCPTGPVRGDSGLVFKLAANSSTGNVRHILTDIRIQRYRLRFLLKIIQKLKMLPSATLSQLV